MYVCIFFFFQAEDGIRDGRVTGVQTCALPICRERIQIATDQMGRQVERQVRPVEPARGRRQRQIGRASCRERGESSVGGGSLKKKKREGGRRGERRERRTREEGVR